MKLRLQTLIFLLIIGSVFSTEKIIAQKRGEVETKSKLKWSKGIYFGVGVSQPDFDKPFIDQVGTTNKFGFRTALGLSVSASFNQKWAGFVEVQVVKMKGEMEYLYEMGKEIFTLDNWALEIPLLVQYRFNQNEVSPVLLGGFNLGFPLAREIQHRSEFIAPFNFFEMKKVYYGFRAGAGINIIKTSKVIYFIHYLYGFDNITAERFGDSVEQQLLNQSHTLKFGLMF